MTEITNSLYNICKEQFNLVRKLSKELGFNINSERLKFRNYSIKVK